MRVDEARYDDSATGVEEPRTSGAAPYLLVASDCGDPAALDQNGLRARLMRLQRDHFRVNDG